MADGWSAGLDLPSRPEGEDFYADVGVLATKFELQLAKLFRKFRYLRISDPPNEATNNACRLSWYNWKSDKSPDAEVSLAPPQY